MTTLELLQLSHHSRKPSREMAAGATWKRRRRQNTEMLLLQREHHVEMTMKSLSSWRGRDDYWSRMEGANERLKKQFV